MFRPLNSRQQSKELEASLAQKYFQFKNSKPGPDQVEANVWSQLRQKSPQEEDFVCSQERYNGFLTALDSVSTMKPVVQTSSDQSVKGSERINPHLEQMGGDEAASNNAILPERKGGPAASENSQYLEKYSFEHSKYQFNNPVMGMTRVSADLDFRRAIMRPTRTDLES
jgi:hypothetical protein